MRSFWSKWGPVVFWMALIFYFSHQPDLRSGLDYFWDFLLRKSAHIFEFYVLTLLVFRAVNHNKKQTRSIWEAGLFSLFYAFFDEYHQSFIPGRNGSFRDVLIDSFGILLALNFLLIYLNKHKSKL